ncbi:hypothetical protein KIN20_010545 [Parelaphostrongylus tenuis]|uniref:UPAR/Ly6 domain-containing protein n=1 Tax=Parelaphostrongylus tenuis TaxID=148309 RepID=A0AAD5QP74_PARTN|nr:hypothetical protein KIN20_010545 [Parelaphostrongylus tenuis]
METECAEITWTAIASLTLRKHPYIMRQITRDNKAFRPSFHQTAVHLQLLVSVWSLSCYICGDNNLDEFGECSTQFQYDCQSYASRFPRDETIFCRTTRSKAPNNTYTVMKECISEQDHHRTFPSKGYTIEEECDLVDVRGEEIAYCICRNHNLCNKDSIADQFIAFEEKNPELFGDIDLEHSETEHSGVNVPVSMTQSSSKVDFSVPAIPPPPIVPINDPRVNVPGIESEIRRAQLPTREKTVYLSGSADDPSDQRREASSRGQGNFIASTVINRHVMAVPASVSAGRSPAESTELRCLQCGESDLHSESSDCNRQVVVDCKESDAVCFTRQILLGRDQAAVEKMCVSIQVLKAEIQRLRRIRAEKPAREGYATVHAAPMNDNQELGLIPNVFIFQIAKNSKTEEFTPSVKIGPPASLPPPGALEQPVKSPSAAGELPVQRHRGTSPSEFTKHQSDMTATLETLMRGEEPPPFVQPIIPAVPGSKSAAEWNGENQRSSPAASIRDAIVPVHAQKSLLRCSVCVEPGMLDPTADCPSSVPAHCSVHDTFCLTRQTQNEDGTFTMEKRCMSEAQVVSFIEMPEVRSGCATAKGGLINYCLCQGDLCNHDALLAQAQISGVRSPESQPKPAPPTFQERPQKNESPRPPSTDVPLIFIDGDESAHIETSPAPELRLLENEQELMMRRKAWAEADLTASSLRHLPTFLTMVLGLLLL